MSLLDGFYSLAKNLNKVSKGETEIAEGVISDLVPELKLAMPDTELIALKNGWEKKWQPVQAELEKKQKESEDYWLGKHYTGVVDIANQQRLLVDNLIYESLETFLPLAGRQNPEPMVNGGDDPIVQEFSAMVKDILVDWGDRTRLKLRLKKMTRYWALYFLGVAKITWNEKEKMVGLPIIRPQRMILDPEATIDEGGEYTGYYIGERKDDIASQLIENFPSKTKYITDFVSKNLGTRVAYTEWTTDDYVFWTLKDEVLDKIKAPHWNYDQEQTTDEFDTVIQEPKQGRNHFRSRKKPYVFLSIFNLGLHPYDDTSLIQQNLSQQDLINKRVKQIDKNVDGMNSGLVVSGDSFTKEQAAEVDVAVRKGATVWVPTGVPANAVHRPNMPALPADVFNSLQDSRNELRNIFGTRGSQPQGIMNEKTVRGKILNRATDDSRIGGGVTEYIEQISDQIYNWIVQMVYVYYEAEDLELILGTQKAQRFVQMLNNMKGELSVSVKEGSLIPKDDMTRRNEAVDLWNAKAISPIDLYKRLDDPNPEEMARNLYLWMTSPVALFPDLVSEQAVAQPAQPEQQGQPPVQPESQTAESQILSQVPIQ